MRLMPSTLHLQNTPRPGHLRESSSRAIFLLIVLTLLAAGPVDVEAQAWIPAPADAPTIIVGLEKPFLTDAPGVGFFSIVLSVDGLLSLTDGLTLQVGVPLGTATGEAFGESGFYLGNLRANLLFGGENGTKGWVGVTGLTASELKGGFSGGIVGLASDLDKPEDWQQNVLALRGGWLPSTAMQNGGEVGLHLGTALVTSDEFDGLEAYSRIGGFLRLPLETVTITGTVSTSYLMTDDTGSGERLYAYIDAEVAARDSPFTIFVRAPLDSDTRDSVSASVGIRLRFD